LEFIAFENAWALWLLPLAAVPWLLHLIKRKHFQKTDFPSLILFEEQRIFLWRRSRLVEWLLLICRTLLILFIVTTLADPVVRAGLPGWLSSTRENIVIIYDDSASMAAGTEGATSLDSARIKITDFLKGLGSGSRVAIISGSRGHRTISGFDRPAGAIRVLSQIKPTALGTDLRGALALADRILQNHARPVVVIVSDFQKTACGDTSAPLQKLNSGAKVILLPVYLQAEKPNLVWDAVRASAVKGRLSIEAWLSGRALSETWPISLEQGGRVLISLRGRLGDDGRMAVGMELPRADSLCLASGDDALEADNRYYLAGGSKDIKTCLVICQPGGPEYQILSRALAAYSGVGYRPLFSARPTWPDLKKADLVILASERLLKSEIQLLSRELGPGKGLIAIPPLRADPSAYNHLFSLLGFPAELNDLKEDEPPFRLSMANPGFLGQASVHQVRVKKYWRISSPLTAEMVVGGQDPGLIWEKGGLCPLAVVSFGLDPEMSDIAYRPAFLVLLHRLLEFASDCCPQKQFTTGDSLRLDSRLEGRLFGPKGPVEGRAAKDKVSWPLEEPGWYRLILSGREISLAANIPTEESVLEPLDSLARERLFIELSWDYLKPRGRLSAGRHRAWRFFIILALALLGLESVLRMEGAKKRLTTEDNYGKNIG